jgi:RNA polymerase sigma factor (sigma-70 family)
MGRSPPNAMLSAAETNPGWPAMRQRLWRSALALTRSHQDAEDLTQQTFAAVLTRQPEFIEHVGYVHKTMFRLWLDEQRSMKRRLRHLARRAFSVIPSTRDRDQFADHEIADLVQRAVDRLAPRQRVIDGLDYQDIAATLECPVEAVRATLHLARKRLREALGEVE